MSKVGVTIAILLALALALAAWVLLPARSTLTRPADNAPGTSLLSFSPSEVVELIVEHSDGRREQLTSTRDGWIVQTSLSGETNGESWPIEGAQMRGMIAVLERLEPVAQSHGETISPKSLTVRLVLGDHSQRLLRLDPRSIGGRRLVQAGDETPVYIDQPIYEALTKPGPMGWRRSQLFRGLGAEVARLTIQSPTSRLSLARLRGKWFLREPVRSRADDAAVGRLMNQLAALVVTRWVDDPDQRPDAGGRASADALRIVVERDRRVVDQASSPRVDTDRQEIIVGPPAGALGKERYVYLGADGPAAVIQDDLLSSFTLNPADFASKTAFDVDLSQVGAVRIRRTAAPQATATIRRTLDGWRLDDPAGAGAIVSDELVGELASMLLEQGADEVALASHSGQDDGAVADVDLFDFHNGELGSVNVSRAGDGVALRSDGLIRLHRNMALPRLLTSPLE